MSDLLQKNQFTVSFTKIRTTIQLAQNVPIPGVSATHTKVGTPFAWIKEPDTKLEYADWNINFKLDENLDAYLEVFDWLTGTTFPDNYDQYKNLKGNVDDSDRRNIFADATLTILDNTNHVNLRVIFKNIFPTALTQVDFDTTVTDAVPIDVTATFAYQSFTIEKI